MMVLSQYESMLLHLHSGTQHCLPVLFAWPLWKLPLHMATFVQPAQFITIAGALLCAFMAWSGEMMSECTVEYS